MRLIFTLLVFCMFNTLFGQKKPLDHTVYDNWQAIGERIISNDGKYIAWQVNPQEGDGVLMIKSAQGNAIAEIARGYSASITANSQFLICKIKPLFKDTRDAKIKKKKPEEMPKDSMAIIDLSSGKINKIAKVKSFKLPEVSGNTIAYLMEKASPESPSKPVLDSAAKVNALLNMADSLLKVADSIRNKAGEVKSKGLIVLSSPENAVKKPAKVTDEPMEEGADLILKNLATGDTKVFKLVNDYLFNKNGDFLVVKSTRKNNDSTIKSSIVKLNIADGSSSLIFSRFNEVKGLNIDEAGTQIAFVAERDSSIKSLQKFYKLYYHSNGMDSAQLIADQFTKGVPANYAVSEFSNISFSKTGKRLFFGTAPILPKKDTTLPDFERVNVDVWGQNDDYIQPVQLKNLESDLKKNYLARYDFNSKAVVQLGNPSYRMIVQTNEGDGNYFYGIADEGKRIAAQWQGFTFNDVYVVNPENGNSHLIKSNIKGMVAPSSTGNFLLMYDEQQKKYAAYNAQTKKITNVGNDIPYPLYDEENDVPDDPNAYGVMGWTENDENVLVYDKYDIWKLDPYGINTSSNVTKGFGRKNKWTYRNILLDKDDRFIKSSQQLIYSVYDNVGKGYGIYAHQLANSFEIQAFVKPIESFKVANVIKSKYSNMVSYSTETFKQSPDIKVLTLNQGQLTCSAGKVLQTINDQQANYSWGTAELYKWKAYTGKEVEGVLYKPENFDPTKKYPMIVYFYERLNNTLYNYVPPAPTPSRLNISFFVSRGYVVFAPDIWYTTGYPGKGAYDHIVSGTRSLVQKGFIDSTKIGLQGQSWGGFQIVYLITKTNLYAAAWAGAPVANMTSAYGGIRWGTGLNRQFQYEKTQSRIGATLWEKPNLYLENSALFSLPKVKTPLVIMANDADDAVPWYQGIEMYTGLRRLGKPVWMLNYNNEAHNLVERKNRKDIQIREQQFFDYLLKGEKPAKWIAEGVPAVLKGRDWGLGY